MFELSTEFDWHTDRLLKSLVSNNIRVKRSFSYSVTYAHVRFSSCLTGSAKRCNTTLRNRFKGEGNFTNAAENDSIRDILHCLPVVDPWTHTRNSVSQFLYMSQWNSVLRQRVEELSSRRGPSSQHYRNVSFTLLFELSLHCLTLEEK